MPKFPPKRGGGRGASNSKSALVRKANAAGFAKRRARSEKVDVDPDVYDYQPEKTRRGNISMALDEDESRGAGYDDEDEEEEEARSNRRPRLIGEGEEDERIGSDEDEEIDSDAAFEESDEERFAEFSFKKKAPSKSKKASQKKAMGVRFAEVNLDEEDHAVQDEAQSDAESGVSEDESVEEEEEGEDDEFLDVLDVLDGRGEPDFGEEDKMVGTKESSAAELREDDEDVSMNEDEDEEDEEEGDEAGAISGSDEDEADPSALDALENFVSGLETGTKRKASEEDREGDADENVTQVKKKKRLLKDRTESGIENEFGARAAGSSKLSLDDLLTPLASKQNSLSALKKSMKSLAASSDPKKQPLAAPLPTRTQEKLEREAAYEQTKQEVDKWTDTMKRIKEAEHLSFPLQAPRDVKVSNLELTAKFKPTTELESSIDRLLKSAKLREEDINKTEDLMMKDLTVEEVAERRAELRKMRELAFRADSKAKRVAKIKSKAFRRIQRKERVKLDVSSELDEGDEEEQRLKAETERARERATLKHKNTGKWAKAMKARGELDVDQRKDISEMLERGEKLRRRIQGAGSGSDGGSGSDDSDEDELDADGVLRIKTNAFYELEKLRAEDEEEDSSDGKKKAKSVFQMKFMKDAAARKNFEVDREIDDFRRQVGDLPVGSDDEDVNGGDTAESTPIERINGRMVFRPGPQSASSLMLPPPPPSAISETSTLRSHDSYTHSPILTIHDETSVTPPPLSASTSIPSASFVEPSNPWLAESPSSSKLAKRKNELVVGKNVTQAQKSEGAMQKHLKKGADERLREHDDAAVEIDTDEVLVIKSSENPNSASAPVINGITRASKKNKDKKKKKDKGKGKEVQRTEEDDSDINSEVEDQEAALKKGKKLTAFEQRELVARAFAGDNVVREFADEKRKEIEADAPREVDTTLAGWGSWGGAGVKKTAPKAHLIKKVAGIDPKSRADYGKSHVIISERRDKKALKFAVKDLPYPYTSKAQFDARMDTPIGAEWNTRLGFQRGTLPRVVKKMGTIIDPLEKL